MKEIKIKKKKMKMKKILIYKLYLVEILFNLNKIIICKEILNLNKNNALMTK